MTAIDNIINQIEGETQNRGNTKTRIAAVLRLLRNKIANLFSDKLDKGTYSGNAGDLIVAIGNKVDKVPGKMLSTNDFTNELRTKLEGLRQVDISGLLPKGGYTGTAQNLKELIDNIMRILQSPDTELDELREIVAYIKQNKRVLDTLGISNIAGLQDALNGKAPTDHHHDDRYSRLGHTHSEYALRTHRHHWDNIDGKPALATEGKIVEAVNGIKIGGRNYLKRSNQNVNNNDYNIANYSITEPIREGEIVTVSLKGNLGAGKQSFALYNSGGIVPLENLIHKGGGLYQATFTWRINISGNIAANDTLSVWTLPNSVNANSSIEWIKLERGNTPTDWSPAPEDLLLKNVSIEQNWTATEEWADRTVFVQGSCNVELNQLPHLASISFRKALVGGAVTFTCTGKTIIYTGDNAFKGGDGSTAVVSIWNQKCYIDIRNV